MLFNIPLAAAFAGLVSSSFAQDISAAELASGIDSITTLTRVGTAVMNYVVYVDNPSSDRLTVIGIVKAMTTQTSLLQDAVTGTKNTALMLDRRSSASGPVLAGYAKRAAYTADEQRNITTAYTTLVNATEVFMGATMTKHNAIVAHNAAYAVAQSLTSTAAALGSLTDVIAPFVPLQADVITAQRAALVQPYNMIIQLYNTGAI